MDTFIKFISDWATAVVSGFSEYPLAAAIVTLIAAVTYVAVWKIKKIDDWTEHCLLFFCVLVGWLILVPLLGAFFKFVGYILAFIGFLYSRYETQPGFFLATSAGILILGLIWFLLPGRWNPNRLWRVAIAVIVWLVIILVGVPIVNALSPKKEVDPKKKTAAVQRQFGASGERKEPNSEGRVTQQPSHNPG